MNTGTETQEKAGESFRHSHDFLGDGHEANEKRTWAVIWLCGAMMVAEIVGGALFGSIALIADGLHMSTHAGALLIAALAYTYARRHRSDSRFAFGTGKLGDLAGFTSAIVLAMIAVLIGYEAVARLLAPVAISFDEAIPIAVAGLAVNALSAWLLSGSHDHGHSHSHGDRHRHVDDHGHHPLNSHHAHDPDTLEHHFHDADPGDLRQVHPHAHHARSHDDAKPHAHGAAHRDNNMRAAFIHVMADAAVSILVIAGLVLARTFGWVWMDPVAGIVGALVIASWAYGLVRDTGAILLDVTPDGVLSNSIRSEIETGGDTVADLHLWRLGPGHLGAIVSVATSEPKRRPDFYRAKLARFPSLSHVTVEVQLAR